MAQKHVTFSKKTGLEQTIRYDSGKFLNTNERVIHTCIQGNIADVQYSK